jgi:hypothetical protein
MINLWREDGTFIEPRSARKRPVGKTIARLLREWGTKYFIPFSSMHIYERADSAWARKYHTELLDYAVGFGGKTGELLPAFIRYDVGNGSFEQLNPAPRDVEPIDPKEYGDDWSEQLDYADKEKITQYFRAIEHLEEFLDFINIRVGDKDHVVTLARKRFNRGITFEAPRHSLMTSIEREIFDDMLNGNFMRTTLHGRFNFDRPLYPDFTPYVTKYADNGMAKSREELFEYFQQYMARAPLDYLKHRIEQLAVEKVRYKLEEDSPFYKLSARTYHFVNGARRRFLIRPRHSATPSPEPIHRPEKNSADIGLVADSPSPWPNR